MTRMNAAELPIRFADVAAAADRLRGVAVRRRCSRARR